MPAILHNAESACHDCISAVHHLYDWETSNMSITYFILHARTHGIEIAGRGYLVEARPNEEHGGTLLLVLWPRKHEDRVAPQK